MVQITYSGADFPLQKPAENPLFQNNSGSTDPRRRGRGSVTETSSAMAVLDQHHAVGERERFGHVVRNQNGREFLFEPHTLDQSPAFQCGSARRARRAVRPAPESAVVRRGRARQRHALLLSADSTEGQLPARSSSPTAAAFPRAFARFRRTGLAGEANFPHWPARSPRAAVAAPGT